jgi:hypothetical protein
VRGRIAMVELSAGAFPWVDGPPRTREDHSDSGRVHWPIKFSKSYATGSTRRTPNATHQMRGTGHRPPDTKCGTPAPGTRRQKPEATYRLESHGVTHTRPRLVQTLELGRSLRDPARGVKANAQDNVKAKAKAKPRPRAGPRPRPGQGQEQGQGQGQCKGRPCRRAKAWFAWGLPVNTQCGCRLSLPLPLTPPPTPTSTSTPSSTTSPPSSRP